MRRKESASFALAALAMLGFACGRGAKGVPLGLADGASAALLGAGRDAGEAGAQPEDPVVTDLWTRAAAGDADDLARLESRLGSEDVRASFAAAPRRLTVLRALGYADDFTALPFLASVAAGKSEPEAAAALESIAFAAALPRRASDAEDALEVHEGCAGLVLLAKDTTRPPPRRVLAIRALRLLADRGWVEPASIPTDLDAR